MIPFLLPIDFFENHCSALPIFHNRTTPKPRRCHANCRANRYTILLKISRQYLVNTGTIPPRSQRILGPILDGYIRIVCVSALRLTFSWACGAVGPEMLPRRVLLIDEGSLRRVSRHQPGQFCGAHTRAHTHTHKHTQTHTCK